MLHWYPHSGGILWVDPVLAGHSSWNKIRISFNELFFIFPRLSYHNRHTDIHQTYHYWFNYQQLLTKLPNMIPLIWIYSRVPSYRDLILHDITHITGVTETDYKSEFGHTKDTPLLALTGELRGIFVKIWDKIDRVIYMCVCAWVCTYVASFSNRYC